MTQTHAETAGASLEAPAVRICARCKTAPRDRKNSSYCRDCRNAHAAEYRLKARPRPQYEQRTCALDGCDETFEWCSMRPKQECCSKSHYMQKRWRDDHPIPVDSTPEDMRWCSGCQALRHQLQFSPSQWARSQKSARCRRCMAKYETAWKTKNKERNSAATRRYRAARLLRRYGAYTDDIDQIVADQGGVCYLCGYPADTVKGFHIDHCHELHEQGKPSFRGLACHGCNVGIGALGDDPDRMIAVAERLRARKAEVRASARQPFGRDE